MASAYEDFVCDKMLQIVKHCLVCEPNIRFAANLKTGRKTCNIILFW